VRVWIGWRIECPPTPLAGRWALDPLEYTGRYYADERTLAAIEANGQFVLRYAEGENFNGSTGDIAGVRNEQGNVFGLMPHPEHAVDTLTGSSDGLCIFASMRMAVEGARV
jgi:phosphoribosylformylglycinamidine (FGAM) synthase-like amidotransferase family enzyme